jgi:spore maturation protein A
MINFIWFFILIIGLIFGIASGVSAALSKSIIDSASSTVQLIMQLGGIMCLWCGIMKIAEESGLIGKIAIILKPLLGLIFSDAKRNDKAMGAIVMNLTANMFGLSNAATPFGIKAMQELGKINPQNDKETASNDMAIFLVLNAACIQLIPTTIISIRAAVGSQNPAATIVPSIVATGTAAIVGVIICKILQKYF